MNHPLVSAHSAAQLRERLAKWFESGARTLPWRSNPTPYAVLVSEFMLQQTQVSTVIPYFERWMRRFPDVYSLAAASEGEVLHAWQGLGYYSRARNLHRAAQEVVERFAGTVPNTPGQLSTLPGVGAYTAGAVAAFAYDAPVAAVDANIARVLARLGNIQTPVDSPAGNREVWNLAAALLPAGRGGRLHTSSLMELGALLCLPKKPQCLVCPLREMCRAVEPESLPRKSPRKRTVSLEEHAAWIVVEEAVLLERQTGRRSKGLWKLPQHQPAEGELPLFQTVFPFTHHKVTLLVYSGALVEETAAEQSWFALHSVLDEAALPSGHRRAVEALRTSHFTAKIPQ